MSAWGLVTLCPTARRVPQPIRASSTRANDLTSGLGVEVVESYTLRVGFTDGSEQVIDFKPVLAGELYGPLLDLQLFNRVSIDPEVKTLVWPNGADFDPATLHDWPTYQDAFAARAREWASVSA